MNAANGPLLRAVNAMISPAPLLASLAARSAAHADPPDPCSLPAEDWELLFSAVLLRLRVQGTGASAGAPAACRAMEECLDDLRLLHAAAASERAASKVR